MKLKLALLAPSPRAVGKKELEGVTRLALRNAQMVKDEDTEVVPCFPERGVITPEEHCYRYLVYRSETEMYEAAIQIERDGYDAVMIFCFHEPAILQMRQALNIPVVGVASNSMLFATTMGGKFSIVTLAPIAAPLDMEIVERCGLKGKLASIRSVATPLDQQVEALVDAREAIEEFQRVGRECIADGAEVLLCGCMLMSVALASAPGCEKDFPNGLREVDGVPIVDNVSVMVKAAESMVALKRAGIPWISRKCTFAKASREVEDRARAALPYEGSAYFTL